MLGIGHRVNTPEDLSYLQGYMICIFFDSDLNVDPDYSGFIQVEASTNLEYMQSLQLTMLANGYFYTYLANYSDQLVTFDNLTIHYKQSVLKAQYDYYPYGLPWGMVEDVYNETAMTTEFNTNEWGIDGGLDMNYFEARFYDPVLARWHSNDPLEQFHSPYLAMCADPANFTDPDGRAGIPFLQDFMKTDLGMACEMFVSLAGMVSGTALLSNIGAIGGTIGNMVSGAISIGTTANSIKNMAQLANEGSKVGQGGSFNMSNELIGEINSHGNGAPNWERVNRTDGSFQGNLIWMDGPGTQILPDGNVTNVEMFYITV